MKKLLIAVMAITTFSAFGGTLHCDADADYSQGHLVTDKMPGSCHSEIDGQYKQYYVTIDGIGLSARFNNNMFKVSCTSDSPVGTYAGIKASATLGAGVDGGVFVGAKGACVIYGVNLGIGAGLVASKLKVMDSDGFGEYSKALR